MKDVHMGSSMIQMGFKQHFGLGPALISAFESHMIQSPLHLNWLDRPICRSWQMPGECQLVQLILHLDFNWINLCQDGSSSVK